ncbi:alcohol oxidase [Hymenopellis radicata]|nr:alcohol oxidase [Hymenopellis radicata]
MSLPHFIDAEYDIVFAGGGTAACVTASRLAEAGPDLRILVLESGPTTKDKLEHIQPGRYLSHLAPTSQTAQFYTSPPSEHLAGRSVVVASGRCIGGGSSINFALYNRPAASDFDAWETEFGNPGWSAKDLIPLLQKAETYEIDTRKPTHGREGPLKVSYGGPGSILGISKQILDIGPKLEKDRPFHDEGNGFGTEIRQCFLRFDGRRSDVAHHYVYYKGLKNLSVLDGCLVNRIIIEDGVATGVEYCFDRRSRGKKLVVRSGIGSKDRLEQAGIPVVVDLPGVGSDYQDHSFYILPFIADPAEATFEAMSQPEEWIKSQQQWEKDGGGRLGGNGVDGVIKMRPLPHEIEELGPELAAHFNEVYADKPDKPLFWLCASASLRLCIFLGYPESRGSLHIASADPYAAPTLIQDSDKVTSVDIAALRWGYKKGREIMRRLPAFRGAVDSLSPTIRTGYSAGCNRKSRISAADDDAIDQNIRERMQTTWHSGGVVDSQLNVYGVKCLKIVDLSIAPSNVNSNTASAAIAIGEKAALIIANELGIAVV